MQTNRHLLQPEDYSFHFWCERAFTVDKNITLVVFVFKEPSTGETKSHNALRSIKVMPLVTF